MEGSNQPIIVEQLFNASAEIVWQALTQVDQMRQWFFGNIESFNPEVGFETQFLVQTPERRFLHLWKLTEVIPEKKIKYDWKYGGYPGESTVVFELFAVQDQTKLILTHQVIENFPSDIPEFSRESGLQGWTYFIKERLVEFLQPKATL